MKRRRFFELATLSLAGLALPAAWSSPLRADTLFHGIFGSSDLAAHIGRLYRMKAPGAAARGMALVADLAACPADDREERLRARAGADLVDLDVVVVDGWVMARSEADLCAAVHRDRSRA